jgi:peptide-methionine (S)-S-oxide reductase
VAYTAGDTPNATYRNHGSHAEAIEITYDPSATTYRELLEFFFQIHDPSTPNQQGNDVGTSNRSAIFYLDEEQARSPRTRSPMSTPAGCGRARSSPRHASWAVLGG